MVVCLIVVIFNNLSLGLNLIVIVFMVVVMIEVINSPFTRVILYLRTGATNASISISMRMLKVVMRMLILCMQMPGGM